MKGFLLDEHVSPRVARQLRSRRPPVSAVGLVEWEGGRHLGARDEDLLVAALDQGLVLVTYDLRTIVPLLKNWGEQGIGHGGVVLVDERSLAPNDFGGQVRALGALWDADGGASWRNCVVYLSGCHAPLGVDLGAS